MSKSETIQDRAPRYIQDSLAAPKATGLRHPQWSMDDLDEFREYVALLRRKRAVAHLADGDFQPALCGRPVDLTSNVVHHGWSPCRISERAGSTPLGQADVQGLSANLAHYRGSARSDQSMTIETVTTPQYRAKCPNCDHHFPLQRRRALAESDLRRHECGIHREAHGSGDYRWWTDDALRRCICGASYGAESAYAPFVCPKSQ